MINRACRHARATRLELAPSAMLAALLTGVLLNSVSSDQGKTRQVAAKQLIGFLRNALAI